MGADNVVSAPIDSGSSYKRLLGSLYGLQFSKGVRAWRGGGVHSVLAEFGVKSSPVIMKILMTNIY